MTDQEKKTTQATTEVSPAPKRKAATESQLRARKKYYMKNKEKLLAKNRQRYADYIASEAGHMDRMAKLEKRNAAFHRAHGIALPGESNAAEPA